MPKENSLSDALLPSTHWPRMNSKLFYIFVMCFYRLSSPVRAKELYRQVRLLWNAFLSLKKTKKWGLCFEKILKYFFCAEKKVLYMKKTHLELGFPANEQWRTFEFVKDSLLLHRLSLSLLHAHVEVVQHDRLEDQDLHTLNKPRLFLPHKLHHCIHHGISHRWRADPSLTWQADKDQVMMMMKGWKEDEEYTL